MQLLPSDKTCPSQGEFGRSIAAGAGQHPDLDHQARRRLHDWCFPAGNAGSPARLRRGRYARHCLRRGTKRWPALRRQRMYWIGLGWQPTARWCRRGGYRRHKLHEPASRGDRDGMSHQDQSDRGVGGLRRPWRQTRRTWPTAGIRNSRRHGATDTSRRTVFFAGAWLAGGEAGSFARSRILRADGSEEVIRSKIVCNMGVGDRLIVETPGGGGYGPKADRNPADIQSDIDNHKVSAEAAKAVYGFAPEARPPRS